MLSNVESVTYSGRSSLDSNFDVAVRMISGFSSVVALSDGLFGVVSKDVIDDLINFFDGPKFIFFLDHVDADCELPVQVADSPKNCLVFLVGNTFEPKEDKPSSQKGIVSFDCIKSLFKG